MYNFDLRGLFFFAVVGMIAAVVAVVVGIPLTGWWLWQHVTVTL